MAALQAAKRASKLEDQLHAARAEQEVLVTQSEEASARVAAAQAARDRAVKEVVIPCSPMSQRSNVCTAPSLKLPSLPSGCQLRQSCVCPELS